MGNKQTAAVPPNKRQSMTVDERQAQEKLRHQEKIMLGFFDSIGIPIDEQVVTWVQLKKGNIFQLKHLAHQSQEALESLGISSANATKICEGKPGEYEYMPTKLQASTVKRTSVQAPKPPTPAPPPPVQRLTKFVKGDKVEHFRESDELIRAGKIVGVHLDIPETGPYYTMQMPDGNELQCLENKLDFVGGWEAKLEAKRKSEMQADEDLL